MRVILFTASEHLAAMMKLAGIELRVLVSWESAEIMFYFVLFSFCSMFTSGLHTALNTSSGSRIQVSSFEENCIEILRLDINGALWAVGSNEQPTKRLCPVALPFVSNILSLLECCLQDSRRPDIPASHVCFTMTMKEGKPLSSLPS
ncbi:hypothetical protein BJX62DRAFT_63501 [Aspergillus germanicus]